MSRVLPREQRVRRTCVPLPLGLRSRNDFRCMRIAVVLVFFLLLLLSGSLSADCQWTHTHDYKWGHKPVPGHGKHVKKTREC